jgi:hypothetical protein
LKQLILIVSQALWSELKKPFFLGTASYHQRNDTVALCWEGYRVPDDFHTWWESLGLECSEFLIISHDGTEEGKETYGCYHDHPFKLSQSLKVWID